MIGGGGQASLDPDFLHHAGDGIIHGVSVWLDLDAHHWGWNSKHVSQTPVISLLVLELGEQDLLAVRIAGWARFNHLSPTGYEEIDYLSHTLNLHEKLTYTIFTHEVPQPTLDTQRMQEVAIP